MKNGQLFVLTGLIAVLFAASSHFGVQTYFQARELEGRVAFMNARTRMLKQQMGELEQKLRVVQRVDDFVEHAQDLQLTPEQWARYDVQVQDALTFKELSQMIEQCVHNKDFYYLPLSFHVATRQAKNAAGAMEPELKVNPPQADATDKPPADLVLSLKGAFFVRH
jgi:hypothetical protein